MNVVLLLACFLAYSVAQQQPVVTQLTNGTTVSGVLPINPDMVASTKHVDRYSYYIPLNVNTVTILFNPDPDTTSACSQLFYYYSFATIPCGSLWTEDANTLTTCRQTAVGTAGSELELVLRAGEREAAGTNTFAPGSTLYFSVGKEDFNADYTCPYTISVINSNCSTSQVGIYSWDYENVCAGVTDLDFPALFDAAVAGEQLIYRFPVEQLVGSIQIEVNVTGSLTLAGGFDYPASMDSWYHSCGASGQGLLSFSCDLPAARWFYLALYKYDSSSIDATVSVSSLPCSANEGGPGCSWYAHNYTDAAPVNRTIRAYNFTTDGAQFVPSDYYYLNLPAGTVANINFTVCTGAPQVSVAYRKDGYPWYWFATAYEFISDFECITIAIRPEDTFIGGTYFVAVSNPSMDTTASYQISKSVAVYTPPGDPQPSGAATLTAPLVAVFVMLTLGF